ncbi:EAL domain-containing protein [Aliihoeflea aestuarii]|uniref:putative bifunctional diguanylate cyclase/phosphodiesterase n=1 Tax=Aliihoeflea aestuarii TaxID=453840 RepID=UPI0020933731|nr:GGDEF domain-containing phosphodiesterase [Aliihoeflea aestuarii]MCO6391666.1 EAL domain-containing protein [Aliihoeflea aestuarii]
MIKTASQTFADNVARTDADDGAAGQLSRTSHARDFPRKKLRALYAEDRAVAQAQAARQGLWIAVLAYISFSVADLVLIPDVARDVIAMRFSVGILSILVFELLYKQGARIVWLEIVCATALAAGYSLWLIPALRTEEIQNFSYFMIFGSIFMMGANLFFSLRFSISLIASAVILVAFFIALALIPGSFAYRFALSSFYLSCFVFTCYVNLKLNIERFNVFLNALEARLQQQAADERGEALYRLSRADPLTGLHNRRAIDERMHILWNDFEKNRTYFAVLLVDVDFFKRFNDFYGHQEGDRCLTEVADALRAPTARRDAMIGRYGGEEFIVLAAISRADELEALAEDIRRTVETLALPHEQRRDGTSVVTVSVGASIVRCYEGSKLEHTIYEADRALYLAKASGRNCIRIFDPADFEGIDDSENIAALLRIALQKDLVSLVYQPIEDVQSGDVVAAEALMRLRSLDGLAISPAQFIPVAERTGAIIDLGRWSIETVCRDLLLRSDIPIATVNVSPLQLKMPGFAASVASILVKTGVAGNRLAFEITEGMEMEIHSDIIHCIHDLRLLGVEIWLDDFGTGFAGLSWLRLIEFDTVKIDRSFLHDAGTARGRAMLDDIIRLLRNRGPKILVEGVESRAQLELVREFGIDTVQGYLLGRPTSATSLIGDPHSRRRGLPL